MLIKPWCLVLDKRWYPCMILNFKKAFILGLKKPESVLEVHPTEKIHTVKKAYDIPIVIKINEKVDHDAIYVNPSRTLIFIRDNWTCQYCGRSVNENTATVDHVIPKSQGGLWSWYNLTTACPDCNQQKGNQIWEPRIKPYRPEPFLIVLKKIIHHLDFGTLDTWKRYLSTKHRKIMKQMLGLKGA